MQCQTLFYQHTMVSAGHGLPRKNEGCPMPNCLCLDWFQMELQANQNVQTASGDRVAQIKLASNYMYMYGGLTMQCPEKVTRTGTRGLESMSVTRIP